MSASPSKVCISEIAWWDSELQLATFPPVLMCCHIAFATQNSLAFADCSLVGYMYVHMIPSFKRCVCVQNDLPLQLLKILINQQRPSTARQRDPGMPSSHANSESLRFVKFSNKLDIITVVDVGCLPSLLKSKRTVLFSRYHVWCSFLMSTSFSSHKLFSPFQRKTLPSQRDILQCCFWRQPSVD